MPGTKFCKNLNTQSQRSLKRVKRNIKKLNQERIHRKISELSNEYREVYNAPDPSSLDPFAEHDNFAGALITRQKALLYESIGKYREAMDQYMWAAHLSSFWKHTNVDIEPERQFIFAADMNSKAALMALRAKSHEGLSNLLMSLCENLMDLYNINSKCYFPEIIFPDVPRIGLHNLTDIMEGLPEIVRGTISVNIIDLIRVNRSLIRFVFDLVLCVSTGILNSDDDKHKKTKRLLDTIERLPNIPKDTDARFCLYVHHRYHDMRIYYSTYGNKVLASEYYQKEMDSWRKYNYLCKKRKEWISMISYKGLCGYGEKPMRVAVVSIVLIILFSFAHLFLGIQSNESIINRSLTFNWSEAGATLSNWGTCLYFSVVSFTSLGYGDFSPLPPNRVFASTESLLGVGLISIFIFCWARKISR